MNVDAAWKRTLSIWPEGAANYGRCPPENDIPEVQAEWRTTRAWSCSSRLRRPAGLLYYPIPSYPRVAVDSGRVGVHSEIAHAAYIAHVYVVWHGNWR